MNQESRHATILIIDLVGYTSRTASSTREQLIELQDIFDGLVNPCIPQYNGNIIKKMGDAFLCSFNSPTNAVHCAINLQKRFKLFRLKNRKKMHIRAVLHSGEVLFRDQDVYGSTVNLCARMEGITPKDEIFLSAPLWHSINKTEIPTTYVGAFPFKGFTQKMPVYKVTTAHDSRNKVVQKIKTTAFTLIALIIVGFTLHYVWNNLNVFLQFI